ncbi:hypothetical protein ACEYW6_32125 [Nostoc sp. UIC 10607]|uniref:hypothetical protein n=1 Tax=Nostoc sp. UIC 10607 TaxID=3045935 RepID=UPI00399FE5D9
MGLAQTQEVLAQLYTNTDFRERFFANPETVCVELGLSSDEAQKLAQLSVQEVNIFANSLKWKRLGEVRELLPRTARALGKNFTALFWRYAQTYLPKGIKKHREDAIAFANFIATVAEEENLYPPWISDLVRYEKIWLLAYEPTSYLNICWFRYPIGITNPEGMKHQPTIAIWFRFSKQSQLRHIVHSL